MLAIGGLDPSGLAGLLADREAIGAAGGTPWLVAAALTAQGEAGVAGVHVVPGRFILAQVRALGPRPAACKLGMLGTAEAVESVAALVDEGSIPPPVLDPVLRASCGSPLSDHDGQRAMVRLLLPRCRVVTPNAVEAGALSGVPVSDLASARRAATALLDLGARAVVLKGGHLSGPVSVDLVVQAGGAVQVIEVPRRPGSVRGTGCRHASFLATALARGVPLAEAAAAAQAYVAGLFGAE